MELEYNFDTVRGCRKAPLAILNHPPLILARRNSANELENAEIIRYRPSGGFNIQAHRCGNL